MTFDTGTTFKSSRRQRRAQSALNKKLIKRDHPNFDLTKLANDILIENLTRFGNELTGEHKAALMCIVGRFTMLAEGSQVGRWAYGLPCGAGKTEAVVAWCAALQHLKKPFSVLVAASKVRELCQLKARLIANGVPESEIALVHSYKDMTGADAPNTLVEAGQRRIVLLTHARINNGRTELPPYQGKDRNLTIWDEAMITSKAWFIGRVDILSGIGYLAPKVNGHSSPDLVEAIECLEACRAALETAWTAQERDKLPPQPISLPKLTEEHAARLARAIPQGDATDPLKDLLDFAAMGIPVRLVDTGQNGGGYLRYDIVVPPSLESVAVLDASWAIRRLEQLDSTITDDPKFEGDVKRFANVEITFLKAAAGRGAVQSDFVKNRKIVREITRVVQGIPTNQAALVWTFKPRAVRRGKRYEKLDMAAELLTHFEEAGIDINASVLAQGVDGKLELKKRINIMTWGNETGLNDFKYCENVLFAGVLHRSDLDLAGSIVGQKRDLLSDVQSQEINDVRRSEVAHILYQAINRGACRDTIQGEAKPMRVWLFNYDTGIKPLLETVMPGVRWAEWDTKFMKSSGDRTAKTTGRIVAYLEALPDAVRTVSIRKLKVATNTDTLAERPYRDARDAAETRLTGWRVEGRSFVRAA